MAADQAQQGAVDMLQRQLVLRTQIAHRSGTAFMLQRNGQLQAGGVRAFLAQRGIGNALGTPSSDLTRMHSSWLTRLSPFGWAENVRAFVGIMTVEVASGLDKVMAYAGSFKEGVAAVFNDDTVDEVGARLPLVVGVGLPFEDAFDADRCALA